MVTLLATASKGYGGTDQSIDETGWAVISPHIGSAYPEVVGTDDLKVTVATGDRTVRVDAGTSVGYGVQVTNPSAVTLQLAAAPANSNRWDAIVLRRDWTLTPGGQSDIIVVQNGVNASRTLPAGLEVTPGNKHDQLLALVQVSSNSTLPSAIDDLRVRASKVYNAPSLAALPSPRLGMEAVIGTTRYRATLNASSLVVWTLAGGSYTTATQTGVIASAAGFSGGGLLNKAWYNAATGDVRLRIQLRRTGAALSPTTLGNFSPDVALGTVVAPFLPSEPVPVFGQYKTGSGAWYPFSGALNTTGNLFAYSGSVGSDMTTYSGATDVSVRADINFMREV
jgi:hypothetical protein